MDDRDFSAYTNEEKAKRQYKYNTNVRIHEGATVVGYAYGGGLGDTKVNLTGDVYGTTYIALLGGTVKKDIYAAGTAGAVNEFLTQLNNCGEDGVLVIAATNKPTDIDEAALRAGRLELKYYIPQPDKETRKRMFQIAIAKRYYDFGIDYDLLAERTENYVSADISLVIDTAARLAFRRKIGKITMALLEEAINQIKSSLTLEQIKRHEDIRDKFMGVKKSNERRKIGF